MRVLGRLVGSRRLFFEWNAGIELLILRVVLVFFSFLNQAISDKQSQRQRLSLCSAKASNTNNQYICRDFLPVRSAPVGCHHGAFISDGDQRPLQAVLGRKQNSLPDDMETVGVGLQEVKVQFYQCGYCMCVGWNWALQR